MSKDTYDGDSVVQQTLAEHDDVQDLVHVNFLEDGQHSDRIDSTDQRREEEHLQEWCFETEKSTLAQHPQRSSCKQMKFEKQNIILSVILRN